MSVPTATARANKASIMSNEFARAVPTRRVLRVGMARITPGYIVSSAVAAPLSYCVTCALLR
jgi:hypothetical protein